MIHSNPWATRIPRNSGGINASGSRNVATNGSETMALVRHAGPRMDWNCITVIPPRRLTIGSGRGHKNVVTKN